MARKTNTDIYILNKTDATLLTSSIIGLGIAT